MNISQFRRRPFDVERYDPTWMRVQREVREQRQIERRIIWITITLTAVALGLAVGSWLLTYANE